MLTINRKEYAASMYRKKSKSESDDMYPHPFQSVYLSCNNVARAEMFCIFVYACLTFWQQQGQEPSGFNRQLFTTYCIGLLYHTVAVGIVLCSDKLEILQCMGLRDACGGWHCRRLWNLSVMSVAYGNDGCQIATWDWRRTCRRGLLLLFRCGCVWGETIKKLMLIALYNCYAHYSIIAKTCVYLIFHVMAAVNALMYSKKQVKAMVIKNCQNTTRNEKWENVRMN